MTGYQSLEQKPYDSDYLLMERVFDFPIQEVWPHVLNIGGWMNAHRLETLSGEPGEVGHFERVYPRSIRPEVPQPHYHLYGIAKIIPYRLIALEVLPEQGGSYGQTREWASFDNLLLADLEGKTQVTFLMIDVYPGKGDEDSRQSQEAKFAEARELMQRYFANLNELLEFGDEDARSVQTKA